MISIYVWCYPQSTHGRTSKHYVYNLAVKTSSVKMTKIIADENCRRKYCRRKFSPAKLFTDKVLLSTERYHPTWVSNNALLEV